jgi:plastocyanin
VTRKLLIVALLAVLGTLLGGASAGATIRTYTYKFGPLGVGPYRAVKASNQVKVPTVSGSIVKMDAHVVDQNDQLVPQSQVMLHHLVFFNNGRTGARRYDGTCTKHGAGERFYGTSEELRAMTLPGGYGYPFDRRDRWTSSWMLMNHTHADRKVFIQYRMTVDDAKLTPVKPYWVSIIPCGADPQYSVRGGMSDGATFSRKRDWKVPISGRIVAVGGHMHGGARGLRLSQPRCSGRVLVRSEPTYGQPDDPVYQVTPLLHEPDPLSISWWQSATGIPVAKGETLRVSSDYDGQFPHMRVMGIDHVYIAPEKKVSRTCAAPPADAQVLGPDFVGRPSPPQVELTLAEMRSDGYAHPIDQPAGATKTFKANAKVKEFGLKFHPAKISIPAGARVRWEFRDRDEHDVTLNNGPVGFGGPWSRRGDSYQRTFSVPGTYKLYCSLHPARMPQVVQVRGG